MGAVYALFKSILLFLQFFSDFYHFYLFFVLVFHIFLKNLLIYYANNQFTSQVYNLLKFEVFQINYSMIIHSSRSFQLYKEEIQEVGCLIRPSSTSANDYCPIRYTAILRYILNTNTSKREREIDEKEENTAEKRQRYDIMTEITNQYPGVSCAISLFQI